MAVLTVNTKPVKAQARSNPSMEMGVVIETLPLAEELLATARKRNGQFSLRMYLDHT